MNIAGIPLKVRFRSGGKLPNGEPAPGWTEPVDVEALPEPVSANDMDAGRPAGDVATARFHFPKGFPRSLAGAQILWLGAWWDVIGDPVPYVEAFTPGPFNLTVNARRADG